MSPTGEFFFFSSSSSFAVVLGKTHTNDDGIYSFTATKDNFDAYQGPDEFGGKRLRLQRGNTTSTSASCEAKGPATLFWSREGVDSTCNSVTLTSGGFQVSTRLSCTASNVVVAGCVGPNVGKCPASEAEAKTLSTNNVTCYYTNPALYVGSSPACASIGGAPGALTCSSAAGLVSGVFGLAAVAVASFLLL
jgi:hypothetical protein